MPLSRHFTAKRLAYKLRLTGALAYKNMNIETSIDRFICFCTDDRELLPDHGELLEELDLLLVHANVSDITYDETVYPDAPEKDYGKLREIISKNFPKLGFYCTAEGEPQEIDKAEVLVGDAIDDLTDIVGDLKEVQWYFRNTSANNALWHLKQSFMSHWGLHARELQLHLHKYWW